MSPIEDIKVGIQTGDWAKVVKGYAGLTGVHLDVPDAAGFDVNIKSLQTRLREFTDALFEEFAGSHGEPEVVVRRNAAPAAAEEPEEPEEPDEDEEDDAPSPAHAAAEPPDPFAEFRVQHGDPDNAEREHNYGKRLPFVKGQQKNVFQDDGQTETNVGGDDSAVLAKVKAPTPRVRPQPKAVKVKCVKCGKTYKVDPVFAPRGAVADKGDQENSGVSYVCDGCISKNKASRS